MISVLEMNQKGTKRFHSNTFKKILCSSINKVKNSLSMEYDLTAKINKQNTSVRSKSHLKPARVDGDDTIGGEEPISCGNSDNQ